MCVKANAHLGCLMIFRIYRHTEDTLTKGKNCRGIQKTGWPVPLFLKNPRINQRKDEEGTSTRSCQHALFFGSLVSPPGNQESVSCAHLTKENASEGQGHVGGLATLA